MVSGAGIILGLIVLRRLLHLDRIVHVSLLGVAIGMYLPVTSSVALLVGGCIAKLAESRVDRLGLKPELALMRKQIGTRIACGLVAGSALMDVLLAIPFSLKQNPEIWRMMSEPREQSIGVIGSIIVLIGLGIWIVKRMKRGDR